MLMYLPYNLAGENLGLYRRGSGKWDQEELIDAYSEAAKAKMDDNPVEKYGDSLLQNPIEFNDWKQNLEVDVGTMSPYNSHCKLVIEIDLPSYNPQYQMFILYLEDWSTFVDTHNEEVKGGNPNGEGGITFGRGKNIIEVTFNEKILEIVKQRGMYILGHEFNLVRLAIDRPKLISFEPQNVVKSKAESQKVSLIFSEDASSLVGSIKFINKFHVINKNLKCIADSNNNKIINYEGLYDFTGKYQIVDEKGIY